MTASVIPGCYNTKKRREFNSGMEYRIMRFEINRQKGVLISSEFSHIIVKDCLSFQGPLMNNKLKNFLITKEHLQILTI